MKRHGDALAINEGACNPSGIALAIVEACREIRAQPDYNGTDQITHDPAVQLMVNQLAWICGISEFHDLAKYENAIGVCKLAVTVTAAA